MRGELLMIMFISLLVCFFDVEFSFSVDNGYFEVPDAKIELVGYSYKQCLTSYPDPNVIVGQRTIGVEII